jgi:hypothetical protein
VDPVSFYLAQVQVFRLRAKHEASPDLAERHRRMADAMAQEARRAAEAQERPSGGATTERDQ